MLRSMVIYTLTPVVPLEAAAPVCDVALDAVATALTQPEYVYLLRIDRPFPNAKMPKEALPAAAPFADTELDAVATALTHPE